MADIIYKYYDGTYVNLTNKCPCSCTFCIRSQSNAIGDAENLFFKKEPDIEEIKKAVDEHDFSDTNTVVFCGYGEPTNALDKMIETAKYIRSKYHDMTLRLNTNGLSDLINGRETAKEICDNIDIVSISLNAPTSKEYDEITRNIYPGKAFDAMLQFTKDCVKCGNKVRMTVVDVIGEEEIERSRKVAETTGAEFVVRSFSAGR